MNRHDRRSPIVATALLVGLITVGLSTAASAEESNEEAAAESSESAEPSGGPGTVTAVLPGDSAMAGEIDLQQLQKSKYFDTLYRLLEQRGSQMKVYRVLQNAGISVKKDVHSLGFATTAARSDKIRSLEKGVVAVSGDFDSEKLTKALTENYAQLDEREVVGGRKVYTVERKGTTGDIGVVSDQLVVGAFGPKSYRKRIWSLVDGDGESIQAAIDDGELFEHIEPDGSAWILQRPEKTPKAPGGGSVESATLSVELGGGIDIETVSRVNSEENAAKMKTKIEEMAKNSEGRAQQMLTMMGATPLLENLEVSQEGKAVVATTSLSEKELDTLIERAKQFMAARRKGAMRGASGPKSGGKTKGGATKGSGSQKPLPIPSKSPSGKEGKSPSGSGSTGSGASGEEGVEADFN